MPLKRRYEQFARAKAKGFDLAYCMKAAGYPHDRRNASRIALRPEVIARVAELVAIAAGKDHLMISSGPMPPDRSGVTDPLEAAIWAAHDAAVAIGDLRGARQSLSILGQQRRGRQKVVADPEVAAATERSTTPTIGVRAFNALWRQHMMTQQERDAEDAEDEKEAAARTLQAERTEAAMAEYRLKLDAMPRYGEETAQQRVAALEGKRRPAA
jgi:hypothetical protein